MNPHCTAREPLRRAGSDATCADSDTAPLTLGRVQVTLFTAPAGPVALPAQADHRLSLHASPPVWAVCGAQPRHRLRYTRGDIDIVPAGQTGAWVDEGPATSVHIWLPPALLERTAEEIGTGVRHAGVRPEHRLRDAHLEHLGWVLEAERRAGFPNGRLFLDSIAVALSTQLLRRYGASTPLLRTGLSAPQRRRLADYIDTHLDQDLSLSRLTRITPYGPTRLKQLFKRSFGISIHQYVIQRRVERARHLLLHDDMPMSRVALEAGFAHQSHMARCMRQVLAIAPHQLRRRRHMD